MSTGKARIGCSGWSYRAWRGLFYPAGLPVRSWFAFYAARFDTVEVNNTFYRLPPVTTVEGWAAQAPPGFLYAVKMGSYGTHRRKLADPAGWLANHQDRAARLGDHLGPTLVQLPPRWGRQVDRLAAFLALRPPSQRWAVEVRDPSWLHEETYDVLRAAGVALVWHDLLPEHPWQVTADFAYLRFHGPEATYRPYHGRYGPRLAPMAERARALLVEGRDIYAYFNNDVGGHAVVDAEDLRDRLGSLAGAPGS